MSIEAIVQETANKPGFVKNPPSDKLSILPADLSAVVITHKPVGWEQLVPWYKKVKTLHTFGNPDSTIRLPAENDANALVLDPNGKRVYILQTRQIEHYHNHTTLRLFIYTVDLATRRVSEPVRVSPALEFTHAAPEYHGLRLFVGDYRDHRQDPFFLVWGPDQDIGTKEVQYRPLSIVSAINPTRLRTLANHGAKVARSHDGNVSLELTATDLAGLIFNNRCSDEAKKQYDPGDEQLVDAINGEISQTRAIRGGFQICHDALENLSLHDVYGINSDPYPRYKVTMRYDGFVLTAERILDKKADLKSVVSHLNSVPMSG